MKTFYFSTFLNILMVPLTAQPNIVHVYQMSRGCLGVVGIVCKGCFSLDKEALGLLMSTGF